MRMETIKALRRARREETLKMPQNKVCEDKRTKRNRTRSEQNRRAIKEQE